MKQFTKIFLVPAMLLFANIILAQAVKPHDPRIIQDNSPKGSSSSSTNGASRTNPNPKGTGATFSTAIPPASSAANDAVLADQADLIKKYAATITAEDLEALLTFIASDELEGRETGTRGQKVAARYLASQFQKIGLKPGNKGSWYQEYELIRLEVKSAVISLTGKESLASGTDFICMSKIGMSESFEADYAFAGYGIDTKEYDNLKGLDLKDKVAVVLSGEPQIGGKYVISGNDQPSEWGEDMDLKMDALEKKGVKAVLVALPDDGFQKLASNRWVKHSASGKSLTLAYKVEKEAPIPTFYVSESNINLLLKKAKTNVEAQKKVLSVKAEVGKVDLSKAKFSLKSDAVKENIIAENVLGMIEGTDKKEEVVILTAHYDHLGVQDGEIFNGADDDGTGTVTLLEVAEAFMAAVKEGHRPRRTILFMPVSGEEKGLLGSEYYSDHPVFPLNKTSCDLNIDMIGRVDEAHKGEPQYIYVIGSDKLSSELHVANENANKIVGNLELDYTFNSPDDPNRFYYRSDHYNFAKHNVPVIFYFSGVHEDYHKSTDDIEKILFPRAARVAQLVFATAWDAANRPVKLIVDKKNDFPGGK
jgi:hypothetical protein